MLIFSPTHKESEVAMWCVAIALLGLYLAVMVYVRNFFSTRYVQGDIVVLLIKSHIKPHSGVVNLNDDRFGAQLTCKLRKRIFGEALTRPASYYDNNEGTAGGNIGR